jgi:predicted membrane channel-forming protein YqfA (hemolysin III family)
MGVLGADRLASGPSSQRLTPVPPWVHAFAWGGVLALVLLFIGVSRHYQGRRVWSGWAESAELRRPAYAERVCVDDLFRTRSDTWSNLAYVLVGFYALALGWNDRRRKGPANAGYLIHTPTMSILFGLACCYLGFGSGLFHASLTRWGQQLDVAAMYAPLVVFIAINVGRWIPRPKAGRLEGGFPTTLVLVGWVLATCFLLYRYKWSMRSGVVLPALILTVAVFAIMDRFQRRRRLFVPWLIVSTLALVAARICWEMDVAGKFSGPDTWFQGHAVWHLLTAISLATMYLYYRSETILDNPAPGVI